MSDAKISRFNELNGAIWRIALSEPLPWMLTYVNVRSGVTADDNSQALPHLWQCLVFLHPLFLIAS